MRYALHPEAEQDLRDAATYYKERAGTVLSNTLFSEFEHAVELLLRHPLLGALWLHGKRRLLMKRFPYAVIYTVAGEEIQIMAITHHSRRPGYWRKRKWQP